MQHGKNCTEWAQASQTSSNDFADGWTDGLTGNQSSKSHTVNADVSSRVVNFTKSRFIMCTLTSFRPACIYRLNFNSCNCTGSVNKQLSAVVEVRRSAPEWCSATSILQSGIPPQKSQLHLTRRQLCDLPPLESYFYHWLSAWQWALFGLKQRQNYKTMH